MGKPDDDDDWAAKGTKDFLEVACAALGHEDAHSICVKKLAVEHSLATVDDLAQCDRTQFERWGVPLKLIDQIRTQLIDYEAESKLSGITSYINYTVRPYIMTSMVATAFSSAQSNVAKQFNAEEWAVLRLQRAFRRKQLRKRELAGAVAASIVPADFSRKSPAEAQRLREERANQTMRMFVARWRFRRHLKGGQVSEALMTSRRSSNRAPPRRTSLLNVDKSGTIFEHCLAEADGEIRPCEVKQLVSRICTAIRKTEDETRDILSVLVTCNWLEEVADLDLVEPNNWEEWQIPGKVVQEIDLVLRARNSSYVEEWVKSWFCCSGRKRRIPVSAAEVNTPKAAPQAGGAPLFPTRQGRSRE